MKHHRGMSCPGFSVFGPNYKKSCHLQQPQKFVNMSIDEEDNMEELEDIKEQALLNKKEFMNKIGEEFIIETKSFENHHILSFENIIFKENNQIFSPTTTLVREPSHTSLQSIYSLPEKSNFEDFSRKKIIYAKTSNTSLKSPVSIDTVEVYNRLSHFKIDHINKILEKPDNQKLNTKSNVSCLSSKIPKISKCMIESPNISFYGESHQKQKCCIITDLNLEKQIINFLNFWKIIPALQNFQLTFKIPDDIGDKLTNCFADMLNSNKLSPNNRTCGLRVISKCGEQLLWSAPEFVFKAFLDPCEDKNSKSNNFLFKIEHIFMKYIDRGMSQMDLEKIWNIFLRKFPLITLESLHIKVFSWLNLNDFALTSILKILTLYGQNITDLQLVFSGAKITDQGLKALNNEILHSVGQSGKLKILMLGIDSRTSLVTDIGFVDILETTLKLFQKNPINELSLLITSQELSNESIEILNYVMAKLAHRITHLKLFIAAQKNLTDFAFKDFLKTFFEDAENLELINIGFLGPNLTKSGLNDLTQSLISIKSHKLKVLRLFYHGRRERSLDLENERKAVFSSAHSGLTQISVNVFLSEKY